MDYIHGSPSYMAQGPARDEAIKVLDNKDLVSELIVAAEWSDHSSVFLYREDLRLEVIRRLESRAS